MKQIIRLTENTLRRIVKDTVRNILSENNRKYNSVNEVHNFNDVVLNRRVDESSVNRMLQWLKNCDCAFISAFRNELKDVKDTEKTYLGTDNDYKIGKKFTHEENRQKNKLMVAELLQLGYGVTKIKGVYPEGLSDETSEESYLVVNRNNDENFLDNLLRISEYYNQDSIYYKEKGETKGNLIGTNDNGWPEYHEKGDESIMKIGTASNYMSRLGNKAFSFIGKDAEKVNSRKEAMDSIKRSKGTDDEWKQRYWRDDDGTSFGNRKSLRKKNMKESVDFWGNIINGGMLILEDIHPLTRKTMGEALRKFKKSKEPTYSLDKISEITLSSDCSINEDTKEPSFIKRRKNWEINNYDRFLDIVSKTPSDKKGYLTRHPKEEITQPGWIVYTLKGYDVAFALHMIDPDKVEIVNVVNNSNLRGIGDDLLTFAKYEGGTQLDNYKGYLSQLYRKNKFDRQTWEDDFNPEFLDPDPEWQLPKEVQDTKPGVEGLELSKHRSKYNNPQNRKYKERIDKRNTEKFK